MTTASPSRIACASASLTPGYRVVIDSAFMGGMEVHTAQWTRALAQAGYPVTLIQTGKDMLSALLADSLVRVVHHPIDPALGKPGEYQAWSRLLRRYPAEVTVYARNGFAVVVLLALWRHSRRLITIDHAISGNIGAYDPNWQPPSRIKTWLSSLAIDHTLAVSDAVRQSAIDVWRVKPARITTCYNWVDTQLHAPDPAQRQAHRQSLGISDDTLVIGSLGRLSKDKRVLDLTRAYALFRQTHAGPSRLVIVGRGAEKENIEQFIHQNHLQDHVLLVDWTDTPAQWHRSFDIEVNLISQEAFGLSAVEAMACGGVLLAQTGGGVSEYVEHQSNGFLADMPTPESIASWLVKIAGMPVADRRAIGEKARQTAVSRFAPAVAMAHLLHCLGAPAAAASVQHAGPTPTTSFGQ